MGEDIANPRMTARASRPRTVNFFKGMIVEVSPKPGMSLKNETGMFRPRQCVSASGEASLRSDGSDACEQARAHPGSGWVVRRVETRVARPTGLRGVKQTPATSRARAYPLEDAAAAITRIR